VKFYLPLFIGVVSLATSAHAQSPAAPAKIRVACVGDSITAGVGAKSEFSYPVQLGKLLGEKYEVKNFGNSGSTMLRTGDKPYESQPQYRWMLDMKADIYVIKLGTNDTKIRNWVKKEDFKPSASTLIDAIRDSNSAARIFVCLPIPAFPENFGITDAVIKTGVIPQLKEVAAEKNVRVIDLYKAMEGKGALVPDKVHPNAEGYTIISQAVYKAITAR
jgi:acyl-CoA thioesterase-1